MTTRTRSGKPDPPNGQRVVQTTKHTLLTDWPTQQVQRRHPSNCNPRQAPKCTVDTSQKTYSTQHSLQLSTTGVVALEMPDTQCE